MTASAVRVVEVSSPDPGPAQPRAQRPALPPESDASTDPGRAQPYESLYRDATDGRPATHRTTPRHFEPALTPPEEQRETGDRFHWLYRPEPDPEVPADSPSDEGAPGRATPTEPAPSLEPPTSDRVGVDHFADEGPLVDEPGRPRPALVVLIAVALLALGAGVLAAAWLTNHDQSSRGARPVVAREAPSVPPTVRNVPSGSASPVPSPGRPTSSKTASVPNDKPYAGGVVPIPVSRTQADCRAPASTDGAGRRVRYDPEQLTDGDLSTAWRCGGSGADRSITFSFGTPSPVAELGLVNGYTKTDPKSHADRYGEYRRIRKVQWTFGNGVSFTQDLADRTETMQTIRIPVQTADQVRLTIIGSTPPGSRAKTRDAVLISEAAFAAPQS